MPIKSSSSGVDCRRTAGRDLARREVARARNAVRRECGRKTSHRAGINYETYVDCGTPPLSRRGGKAEKEGSETRCTAKLNARGRPISFPSFRAVAPRELIG